VLFILVRTFQFWKKIYAYFKRIAYGLNVEMRILQSIFSIKTKKRRSAERWYVNICAYNNMFKAFLTLNTVYIFVV
jgi:hypothetical protein